MEQLWKPAKIAAERGQRSNLRRREALARCDLEITKIKDYNQPYAWLNTLGKEDWEKEKIYIVLENQTPEEYIANVIKTEAVDLAKIKERMNNSVRLLHASIGINTENGEFQDHLKKVLFYGKPLDKVHLIEELGDLMWYIAIAIDELGSSFEEVWEKNIKKLEKRYAGKFSETRAENRDLAGEREVLEG